MRVAILGAGGHAAVVADILFRMRDAGVEIEPVACIDEHPAPVSRDILSVRVMPGGLRALTAIGHDAVIVAIGDNAARRRLSEHLRHNGVHLAIARHPSSMIAPDVEIGPGTVVCAGAVVNPSTRIGCAAILNTHASIDHHNAIGDYVHVAPGVNLGGGVSVGDDTLVGIGSVVLPGRRIGRRAVVGAGALVTRDLPDDVVALGSPARVLRYRTDMQRPAAERPA
jgi:sugar O-acyltransferase (sialic acid O-acetyltransferase NeuD family)